MRRILVLSFLLPLLSGCFWMMAGGAGAAGAYMWLNGELSRNYKQPMETTWEGTLHALRTLRLPVEEKKHDAFYGYIKAKMAKGKTLSVTLERWTDVETKVTVRVGALGDKEVSRRVHEEISRSLK